MARVVLDSILRSISGKLGEVVYRRNHDGSVSACKLARLDPHRPPTPAEALSRARFKAAAAQYEILKQDSQKLAAYQFLMKRRGPLSRLRATVIGDILRPPTITSLELDGYHGERGDKIRITATENVAVARLSLSIRDLATGKLIESAEKLFSGSELGPMARWVYETTENISPGHGVEVTATARDLAGNEAEARGSIPNRPAQSLPVRQAAAASCEIRRGPGRLAASPRVPKGRPATRLRSPYRRGHPTRSARALRGKDELIASDFPFISCRSSPASVGLRACHPARLGASEEGWCELRNGRYGMAEKIKTFHHDTCTALP